LTLKPVLRKQILLYGLAFLMVLIPYLFWRGTWFGRPLSDREIKNYLREPENPRRTQHALVQISERIMRGQAPSVRQWYPAIEQLSTKSVPEVRAMAAWLMGQDNQYAPFQRRLSELLEDPEPMVRRNAALGLVRFGDRQGKPEIQAMLQPYQLKASRGGVLLFQVKVGDSVNPGTLVASIQDQGLEAADLRSPVPGLLSDQSAREGAVVSKGETVAMISPAESQVWEALRALYIVGQPEDLSAVELYATQRAPLSQRVAQQACETMKAIKARNQ
jgi:hypothetical protein